MSMKSSRSYLLVALLLPILGFVGHIGLSQYERQQGEQLRLAITGYDPKDLLRGRYLRFQYRRDNPSTLSGHATDNCYVPRNANQPTTKLLRAPCEAAQTQRIWIDGNLIKGPQKYFIPEAVAPELEREFMEHGGALEVRVLPNGKIVVLELLIKGVPWREHLSNL